MLLPRQGIIRDVDEDESGTIDLSEFLNMMAQRLCETDFSALCVIQRGRRTCVCARVLAHANVVRGPERATTV